MFGTETVMDFELAMKMEQSNINYIWFRIYLMSTTDNYYKHYRHINHSERSDKKSHQLGKDGMDIDQVG